MNNRDYNPHHQPPPPPPINYQNASQILKKTTRIFIAHPLTFIFLSSIIFIFRFNVENGAQYLISFVESDPSLKSFISSLDLSGHHHYQQYQQRYQNLRRRRRAFLHLSRVGTLDDDFFSGDADYDRSLFNPSSKSQPNGTYLFLSNFRTNFGLSADSIVDNGVSFSQIIRSGGFAFKSPGESLEAFNDNSLSPDNNGTDDVVDLPFLIRGLELGRHDTAVLVQFLALLSAAYGYVILAFLVTYTWVNGIVFYRVLNYLLGKPKNIFRAVWDGSNLGLRRLSGFVLMKWAVRDSLAQLIGIYFFGEIDDQYMFFKIFMRMKLMPFSDVALWIKGYEKESLGFVISWFLVEFVVALIFAVVTWVAIVESRKSGREVVREGCRLLAIMLYASLEIKCWEVMACGWLLRYLLSDKMGALSSMVIQSIMEVYFMVAWLLFYLAAKQKRAASIGREIGRQELEGFLEGTLMI